MPKIKIQQLFSSAGLNQALSDVQSLVDKNNELTAGQEKYHTRVLKNLGAQVRNIKVVNEAYGLLYQQVKKMTDAQVGKVYVNISKGGKAAAAELERLTIATRGASAAASGDLKVRARAIAGRKREINRIKQWQQVTAKASTRTKMWSINTNKLLGNLYRLRWSIFSVVALVYMFNRAVRFTIDSLKGGAGLNEQFVTLNALSSKWGETADGMIKKMEKLSAGIMSRGKMVNIANKALLIGLGPDVIKGFTELSRAINRITGEAPEKIFDKFITGTARATERAIAFTGIIISARLAVVKYAKAHGLTVKSLTDLQKKEAFHTAVLAKKEEVIKAVNLGYKTQAEKVAALEASLTNLFDTIKRGFINLLFPPEGAERALQRIKEIKKALATLSKEKITIGVRGAFTDEFREELLFQKWKTKALREKVLKKELAQLELRQNKLNKFADTYDKLILQYEKINKLRDKTITKEKKIGEQLKLHKRQIIELMAELTKQSRGKDISDAVSEYKNVLGVISSIEMALEKKRFAAIKKKYDKERKEVRSHYKKLQTVLITVIKNRYTSEINGLKRVRSGYKSHYKVLKKQLRNHVSELRIIANDYFNSLVKFNEFKEAIDRKNLTKTEKFEKDKEVVRVAIMDARTAREENAVEKYKLAVTAQMDFITKYKDKVADDFTEKPLIDVKAEEATFNHLFDMYRNFAAEAIVAREQIADQVESDMLDTEQSINDISIKIGDLQKRYEEFVTQLQQSKLEIFLDGSDALLTMDELLRKLELFKKQANEEISLNISSRGSSTTSGESEGTFHTGISRVSNPGLYRLDRGERVLSAVENNKNTYNQQQDNSSVVINFYGEQKGSKVEQEFRLQQILKDVNNYAAPVAI